jgi:L-fuconolactonase
MTLTRRETFRRLGSSALAPSLLALTSVERLASAVEVVPLPVIDTHQHLWDLSRSRLPWLASASELLRRSFQTPDYLEATRGLNVVKAVYMEVDVAPDQVDDEARDVLALCHSGQSPTRAAVIGGRPASDAFTRELDSLGRDPLLKGVRQVLHSSDTPAGYCLSEAFVRGIHALGRRGLRFDLCLRPGDLTDGIKLVELCPETRFVLDHCGNADPNAFLKPSARGGAKPSHDPDDWKGAMDGLARRPNVVCKISGIVARARKGFTPDDLAPVINHCLDTFGPDRVMFGGDWPVCLLGSSYRRWVEALRAIVSQRPIDHQRKLWHDNADKFYQLNT